MPHAAPSPKIILRICNNEKQAHNNEQRAQCSCLFIDLLPPPSPARNPVFFIRLHRRTGITRRPNQNAVAVLLLLLLLLLLVVAVVAVA